jgi:Peptidase A4 family
MKKTLTLEGDIQVVTHAPSPNFNPLTASAAEQVANGFPAMPDDPHHRERYARVWGRLKNKFHYVEPTFRVNRDRRHGPRQRRPREGTETSGNWSGGVVYAPAGQSFQWIEGDWVIPAVDAPTQNEWYYCASWIGIDGDGSGDVFQAGVQSEVYASGSSVTPIYYAWWEWFPAYEVEITNFPVSPGDMMTMLLCSAQGAGSTTGTVYWTNITTGATTNATLTAPSGTQLIGNCAEWIVEGNGPLPDYGEVFFSVCEAVTNQNTTVNGGTGNNINMTNADEQVISDGNLITPTIIQCLYVGPQP